MYARRTEGRLGRTSPTRACSDARARHGHCKMDHYDLIKPHAITREDSTLPPILYGRHICLCRALSDALCARIRRQSLCATSGPASAVPWCIYWDGECIKQERERPSPVTLEQLLYNKAAEDSALVKAADVFAKARDKLNPFAKKSK
eukprot:8597588-Pyramimonas_sp.AAC.1